jgi:hypothetical protein
VKEDRIMELNRMDNVVVDQAIESVPATRKSPLNYGMAAPFRPFEMDLKCPRCKKEIGLFISKVHMEIEIHCPDCNRPLTAIIRGEIEKRISR